MIRALAITVLILLLTTACSEQAGSPSDPLPDAYPPPANAMQDYFPKLAFSDTPDHHQFVVDWYAKHLRVMGEPSLYDLSRDESAHAYRFLWLPTWGRPVAVRATIDNEEVTLRAVILTGEGGYEPGTIKSDKTYKISAKKLQPFLDAIEAIDYWSLATRDDTIGPDGEQYILEGVKDGRYQLVDRWTPRDDYADACRMLLKLGKVKEPLE